ncbi:hypothetical protein G7046_g1869 [Stylonectria norvegica]|nr:hypothetical protein G7046_g1869 [Stylonectria norvegica]
MVVTHKNNRLVPAVIIIACVLIFFRLLGGSTDTTSFTLPKIQSSSRPSGNLEAILASETSPAVPTNTADASHLPQIPHDPAVALLADDVLLIMKTGGTTMWKRLMVHLSTTLASERIPPEQTVIYSDLADKIGRFRILDVLANMTEEAKNMPDFDVYRQQPEYMANNKYVEAAGVDGDGWGPSGGWIIDKYKFIPLMQHAGINWPRAKWYIYMEDDTYIFLPNVLAHLSSFDWHNPHYLGSYAAKSDVVFAHGGAGFALSRGAWEASFGRHANVAEDYYNYTASHCCGDQVLGHFLKKSDVKFGEENGNGKFTWGFNPGVHWNFGFSRYNWCSPLLSWHKTHSRDVALYYELERTWDFKKPLLHGDFFNAVVLSSIQKRAEWWNNMANLYEITSSNKDSPETPESAHNIEAWSKAWETVDTCENACRAWVDCVQWTYVEDSCKLDDKMIMGQGVAKSESERKTSLQHTSGWFPERLENWKCI